MGITKREIAAELGVSKRTIANYIGKLGLGNHVSRNGNTDILDDFAAAAIADALKNPEKPSRQPAAAAPAPNHTSDSANTLTPQEPRPATLGRALTEDGEHDDPILKDLMGLGYSRNYSVAALEKFDYNLEKVGFCP